MPQYRYAVARAQYKQVVLLGRAFQKAQKIYHMANGKYATDFDELSIDFPPPTRITSAPTDAGGQTTALRYEWGACTLRVNEGIQWVDMQCYPKNAPTLGIKLDDNDTMYCISSPSSVIGNKICRLDTGQQTPTASGQYYIYYY